MVSLETTQCSLKSAMLKVAIRNHHHQSLSSSSSKELPSSPNEFAVSAVSVDFGELLLLLLLLAAAVHVVDTKREGKRKEKN